VPSPVDLSAALGVPGQPEHPLVVEEVTALLQRIAGRMSAAIYATAPEAAERWIEIGASLVALSADSAMALRAFSATRAQVASGSETSPNQIFPSR
jgi:4-hydroxy-2-oxoheptanedioate aldolase